MYPWTVHGLVVRDIFIATLRSCALSYSQMVQHAFNSWCIHGPSSTQLMQSPPTVHHSSRRHSSSTTHNRSVLASPPAAHMLSSSTQSIRPALPRLSALSSTNEEAHPQNKTSSALFEPSSRRLSALSSTHQGTHPQNKTSSALFEPSSRRLSALRVLALCRRHSKVLWQSKLIQLKTNPTDN